MAYQQPTAGMTARDWSAQNAQNGYSATYGPGADDWTWDAQQQRFGPVKATPPPASAPEPVAAPVAAPPPPAAAPPAPTGGAPEPSSMQPLQMLQRSKASAPNGEGTVRESELDMGLTDRVLPASGRALAQLAAQRGGRIY